MIWRKARSRIRLLGAAILCCWFTLLVSSAAKDSRPSVPFNERVIRTEDRISDVLDLQERIHHRSIPKPLSRYEDNNNYDNNELHDITLNEDAPNSKPSIRKNQQINRIIGGGEAAAGRYDYIASLTKERGHTCGGTLIADDIVLSAAHCWGFFDGVDIGRHDVSNKAEIFERYNVEKSLKHPGYTDASGSFDNDVMVIKLYGWSSKHQVVRLNQDQNIPIDNEDLHVAGWGVVNTATEQTADKLKDVSVYYMTNEECKSKTGRIEGYTQLFTLKNKITDNMMCALDVGEDACQGDSGGPLVQRRSSAAADVQVGVVSWGLGCADPVFPGMYARVSSQFAWIKNLVCSWAEKPPDYYGCLPKQESPPKPKRAVAVEIMLDRFPGETGWLIRTQTGKSVQYMKFGGYTSTQDKHVITVVEIEEETNYNFIMMDSYGDGLKFDGGFYKLWLGDTPHEGIQIAAGATFGKYIKHPFYLPKKISTSAPAPAPKIPTAVNSPSFPTALPIVPITDPPTVQPEEELHLTLGFKFDNNPEEIAWAITSVKTHQLLTSKPFGTYKDKNTLSFEKIPLPAITAGNAVDQYIFAILDSGRDGLCCENGQGFYQVFYGNMVDGNELFRGGSFNYLQQFIFDLDGNVMKSPSLESALRADEDDYPFRSDSDGAQSADIDDDGSKSPDSQDGTEVSGGQFFYRRPRRIVLAGIVTAFSLFLL